MDSTANGLVVDYHLCPTIAPATGPTLLEFFPEMSDVSEETSVQKSLDPDLQPCEQSPDTTLLLHVSLQSRPNEFLLQASLRKKLTYLRFAPAVIDVTLTLLYSCRTRHINSCYMYQLCRRHYNSFSNVQACSP